MTRPDYAAALTEGPDGVLMALEATPGARSPAFPSGYNPWRKRIGIRVTAPAQDGQANAAICQTLAAFFRVPTDRVAITQGATGSQKTIRLGGTTSDEVLARLEDSLA